MSLKIQEKLTDSPLRLTNCGYARTKVMFSEASGHNVVVRVAAGKCSFLVGVDKISTEFVQICLESITGNTAGLCCLVLKNHSDVSPECRFIFNIY